MSRFLSLHKRRKGDRTLIVELCNIFDFKLSELLWLVLGSSPKKDGGTEESRGERIQKVIFYLSQNEVRISICLRDSFAVEVAVGQIFVMTFHHML